ncbi:MAG: polyphosphate kinase 1 [Firmicutes bacterium]|nr:polyphosphate kinase 1 [Bacillota bacterium]
MNKYINRELSWIEFNRRVLEIYDRKNLLLGEKLKFISIFYNNLDEFFMVRVGSLWDQSKSFPDSSELSGLSVNEEIDLININVKEMYKACYERYDNLKTNLYIEGIQIIDYQDLKESEKTELDIYFKNSIYPFLTFRAFKLDIKFPLIKNKTINIFLRLFKDGDNYLGNIQIPENINRLVSIGQKKERKFILLEQLISSNLNFLFDSYEILESGIFRIIRNAGLNYDDEDAEDLLLKVERSIKKRSWGQVVRLEIMSKPSKKLMHIFKEKFQISDREIYILNNDLDLTYLDNIYKKKWFSKLKSEEITHNYIKHKESIIKQLKIKDYMCHLPYDDFRCILDFLEEAANDPKVIAIKQTLYRVSNKSPIVETLIKASNKGKNVTVLLEVKARFDEENNIAWAKRLEKAGVQVILSPLKLKTHAKLILVVRKEHDKEINTYCHIGTGNYNEKTAVTYEDIGVFTADKNIGEDLIKIFNFLASGKAIDQSKELIISPFNSRKIFHELIDFEINEVKNERKGLIRAKMNSFIDLEMINKFYEAADGGVDINLIVRGICGLVPNENLKIKSIVGKFLEHSRLYYFYHGGSEIMLIGSMDLMDRNFDRRVEVLCPIKDDDIKKRLLNILDILDEDRANSYYLKENGKYEHDIDNNKFDAHKFLMNGEVK